MYAGRFFWCDVLQLGHSFDQATNNDGFEDRCGGSAGSQCSRLKAQGSIFNQNQNQFIHFWRCGLQKSFNNLPQMRSVSLLLYIAFLVSLAVLTIHISALLPRTTFQNQNRRILSHLDPLCHSIFINQTRINTIQHELFKTKLVRKHG